MTTNNTPALRQFRNTDDRFGDVGPWMAVSAEAVADEMAPQLLVWAQENHDRVESLYAPEHDAECPSVEAMAQEIRETFLAALVEVE